MPRPASAIKKNDNVVVIAGRDRGKRGRVLRVLPDKGRVIVEGVNFIKRHTRPNPQKNIKGGIVEREAALHAVERAARLPGVRRADARRPPAARRRPPRAVLREVQGSGGQMNRLRERYVKRRRAGAPQGVRLHERHGRAQDHEGRGQHGPRRGHAEREDRRHRRRGARQDHRARRRRSRASKKSIAQFKVRKNMPIGAMVTLRGERMYEFLDRLIAIALPRVRDFRGVSPRGFDGRGNYTLGLRDQLMFPEIDYLKVDKARGMNISVVTTAKTDEEARRLLQLMGMPFRQN